MHPKEKGILKVCVKADLYSPFEHQTWKSKISQSEGENDVESPEISDPVWNETFRFETQCRRDGLAFIRLTIEMPGFLRTTKLGIFCARISHLRPGWRLARLLSPSGVYTGSTLLLNFTIDP